MVKMTLLLSVRSKILHEALLKKGINSELIIDKNGDHCGNNLMPHHTSKMVIFFNYKIKKIKNKLLA